MIRGVAVFNKFLLVLISGVSDGGKGVIRPFTPGKLDVKAGPPLKYSFGFQ